jgi:hypothetical protein
MKQSENILFNLYIHFLDSLKVKLGNANIYILNLYLPTNSRYQTYKIPINNWNKLLQTSSYNIINLYSLLTTSNDFVYDIEPSAIASKKIADIINNT